MLNAEDQFTSIEWERDDFDGSNNAKAEAPATIAEDEEDDEHVENGEENLGDINEGMKDSKSQSHEPDTTNEASTSVRSTRFKGEGTNVENEENLPKGNISEVKERYNIRATVSSPTKGVDEASKPYISYLVETTTDDPSILKLADKRPENHQNEATIRVRRRYGDFRLLHHCLTNDHPQVLVPPLPSKLNFKYLTGDTFSSEFVNKRLHSLDRFIKFITLHKVLARLSIFHLFLSDSVDWVTFQNSLKLNKSAIDEQDKSNSSTITSNVINKVVNEDLLTETLMNFLTPAKHKRETNKEILEISDKLEKLYGNLLKLDKLFSKLNKKNSDLSIDYEQFLQLVTKLLVSQSSPQGGLDDDEYDGNKGDLAGNFKIFASSLLYYLESWSKLQKYIDESFLVSLRDSAKYIISLTNLIELQHNKRIDLQVLQDYLNKARSELNVLEGRNTPSRLPPTPVQTQRSTGIVNNTTQLIKDTLSTSATSHIGSSSHENKVTKLKDRIHQLEHEIEFQALIVLELTNRIICDEYPNWDNFNKVQLKESMLGLCDQQIDFYNGLVDHWNDVEHTLSKRLEELE